LVGGQKDESKLLFLVTVQTTFQVINEEIVTNKDQGDKEILSVDQRTVKLSELDELGIECRKYNQRQEYYIKGDKEQFNAGKGHCKFMYIASKDPTPTKEG